MFNLLPETYFPQHSENRMAEEGNLTNARESFISKRKNNLDALLRQRFFWMNRFIGPNQFVVEVGAGAGFSQLYIQQNLHLTDAINSDWIDTVADAMNLPFSDSSVDVIIASHTIHHFSSPMAFFDECARCLKPNGLVLIQEINTCFLMKILLRLMRHEGWSYKIDIFDKNEICNDPRDPWSANCAIPELLFSNENDFEANVTQFKIVENSLNECFLFPLSGGVISKVTTPELPKLFCKFIQFIDRILILVLPSIFACGRSVAIRKNAE